MNSIRLLLSNPSVNLRLLVLKNLLGHINPDEIAQLEAEKETDKLVSELVSLQQPDGSWQTVSPLSSAGGSKINTTALALARLGYLGFDAGYAPLRQGVEYLFSLQKKDGSWPFKSTDDDTTGYSMVPLQTSLPLQGLALCGYAADPRAAKAYAWLLQQRLDDGAWPTGIAAGVHGYVAGYRRIAHSRWGCRTNTTSALVCLSYHPELKNSPAAHRALDLLLGRNTHEAYCLGYEIARLFGYEPLRGFFTYYAKYDPALMLALCARLGVATEDERVGSLLDTVTGLKGKYGLWTYQPHNRAGGWITYDILQSLSKLKPATDWISHEPVTPFKAYYKKLKRY